MQQNKFSILSTRHVGEAWMKDALSQNISVDEIPFIKTNPLLTDKTLREIGQNLTKSSTVVFTSVNAVEAVALKLSSQGPNWKIFCMGYATKQSVEKYFGEKSVAGIANNAKELAGEIINAKIKDVIFFCGDQRRKELQQLLKQNKIEVNEIIVYETVVTPQKIERNYDGILFFSPSAVRSFFQKNQLNNETVLFAIGNTTADEIKKFTTNKIVISDEPEKRILLEKVISYFKTNTIPH
jgi:uroporphyrinogen-III synthase